MRHWDDELFDREFEKTGRTMRTGVILVLVLNLAVVGVVIFAILALLRHYGVT